MPPATDLSAREPAPCLAILLPGRFGSPQDFFRAGFLDGVKEAGLPIDLIAVGAHLGYYRNRSIIDRLREDVVRPAQARGYEEIWLVGPSMGGLGSLLYAKEHGEDLAGALVLAPFLGEEDLVREIQESGGVRAWKPQEEVKDDVFRKHWQWLASRPSGADEVPLFLAYGTEDRLVSTSELIAELVPEERIFSAPGGHDWKVWATLWKQFLARSGVCSAYR